jgi:hypothetical protein
LNELDWTNIQPTAVSPVLYQDLFGVLEWITAPLAQSTVATDSNWQQDLIQSILAEGAVTMKDLLLSLERSGRRIKDRYYFLIELLVIVYQYKSLADDSTDVGRVLEIIVEGLKDRVGEQQRQKIKEKSLSEILAGCQKAFL